MAELISVDEILDFAIEKEEEAARFYTDLSGRAETPGMRELFEQFAREEQGHKSKLLAVKEKKLLVPAARKIQDLKIAEYLVDTEPTPDMDYQQALIVAMKREKASFKLYTDLAEKTGDENVRATFLSLAQEEARHKLRFEIEYDDYVPREN